MRFIYRGGRNERIPLLATHVFVENTKYVPSSAFPEHPNIVELVCHEDVEKIGEWAFARCPNLRRVIMPGVKVAEEGAFNACNALTDVELASWKLLNQMHSLGANRRGASICHLLGSLRRHFMVVLP